MITQDQIKELGQRRDALRHYLDIDGKKIQVEEEELHTHVPDFWEHPKEAQVQMKKIKDLQGWIERYDEVDKAVSEVETGLDFAKEGLVDEAELDGLYADAATKIEDLELRNMLRREEDHLGVVLKINSGAGGTEPECALPQSERQHRRPDQGKQPDLIFKIYQEAIVDGGRIMVVLLHGYPL